MLINQSSQLLIQVWSMTVDKNRINFNSKEYNENKINIYFYTKEVHKKSKENINNLH